ncbi:NAD(P)/FAD-dependent oxidoreductase [Nocardia pseudobrasiliensis]|uniref:Glycine/D-amino acid oxidase-like deaminating enzyme n=1 Tax=Nocardia pseudobrasiliensis TaxID=45979 RepID=A0A370IAE7_9NOCA|nr:FAD-dependent oxidoreductase [Nocardia pseudobrasiliensis]RDI67590.1 glycine/D-amino acid oxidase-like deaminating enzyme [Nocardia pseudobrasiliensis]
MSEVLIIGAGVIGCALAERISRAGVSVLVCEQGAVASATTAHGEGNVLVSDKGPGPELELAGLSRRLWPQMLDRLAERVPDAAAAVEWEAKGGIVVATTHAGAVALREFAATQRRAGVRVAELDGDRLAAAEPWLTRDVCAAMHYPDDAQVQPTGAATALLTAAIRSGAAVETGCAVTGPILSNGRLVGVRTTRGPRYGDAIVLAAGPWSGDVSRTFGAPIAVRPRRGDVLITAPMPPTVFHKVYDADYVGAVESDDTGLRASAVVEATRGGPLLLGSSRRRCGFDDRLRLDSLSAIARKAIRLFPTLADAAIMRAYGGFRPYVADHLPVIGPDVRLPGLWHATGHEGAGIGLSLATAELLTQMLTGRPPALDPTPFRIDRPAVLAPLASTVDMVAG